MNSLVTIKNALIIFSILVLLIIVSLAKSCSTASELNSLKKEQKKLIAKIDTLEFNSISKLEFKKEMENTMYKFLIFEEDVDKGKMSLSQIQLKLENNK